MNSAQRSGSNSSNRLDFIKSTQLPIGGVILNKWVYKSGSFGDLLHSFHLQSSIHKIMRDPRQVGKGSWQNGSVPSEEGLTLRTGLVRPCVSWSTHTVTSLFTLCHATAGHHITSLHKAADQYGDVALASVHCISRSVVRPSLSGGA